jgi:L-rhamnose isomerase
MYKKDPDQIRKNYEAAKSVYAAFGVDTEQAIAEFLTIPVSLHCWQGDDVKGFENVGDVASQNVVTGNYPGAARNGSELRGDIEEALSMSPCKHRVNLHSIYAEPKKPTPRNELTAEDFRKWIDWAKTNKYALDFNASFFTHPMMVDGFSLASRRKDVRDYWIKAGIGSREISRDIGRELGECCVNNIWIPDGLKDIPANRRVYRENLIDSLDRIFELKTDRKYEIDVLEGKLFGIALESFTVGSHEFYLAYAAKKGVGVCLDTGHYHPTETVVDKLTSIGLLVDDVLLHISRGIRWDSDHVLIQGDDLLNLMLEMKRSRLFGKIGMGLDFFDASINRVAAWVIGLRSAGKSILTALLEPSDLLEAAEAKGDFTSRLALMEEFKNLPINAVWEQVCLQTGVPINTEWIAQLKDYEEKVQSKRKA